MTSHPRPQIIAHAGPLLGRYDVLFCDVWGVVHNGITAFADACRALERFRSEGGTVVLVSNAPVPKHRVADMLATRNVPTSAWDDIVSSGDIALAHIAEQGYRRVYGIGPDDRDAAFFGALAAETVPLERAEAIVCTGLNDDRTERPEDYAPLLQQAASRRLPFVCANPDLLVDVGGTLYFCAGAIADIYQHMGGDVFWAGKPHLNAYETAALRAQELRGRTIERRRTLVIGDALRTDIKGAENYGCDALFIASGIHRHETMDGIELSRSKLSALFTEGAPPVLAAMSELRW